MGGTASGRSMGVPSRRASRESQPGKFAAFFHRRKRNRCFPKDAKRPPEGTARERDPSRDRQEHAGFPQLAGQSRLLKLRYSPHRPSLLQALESFQNPPPGTTPPRHVQVVPPLDDEAFPPLPPPSKPRCRQTHPLEIPELLMSIIEFIGDISSVYQCMFVNHMWYHCATKVLWQQAHFSSLEKATLFLSLFDAMDEQQAKPPSDVGVEPLAVLGTNSCSRREFEPVDGETPRAGGADTIDQPRKRWNRKRGRKGPTPFLRPRPHVLYAQTMRKVVFYKLKALGSPLLITAAGYLPRLTFLEFYICDIITAPVVAAFASNCPDLRVLKVPGCANVSDEAIIAVATHCRRLRHLDARACSLVGDRAVLEVARNCPDLAHINVGRVGGGDRITYQSVSEIARCTKVDTLGLAGCDISDRTVLAIAVHRRAGLERVSFNNCPRITDKAVEALEQYCPRLAVLELKECIYVTDFRLVWRLMQRRVSLELCSVGRHRLEQFQRAELAKIAAGQDLGGSERWRTSTTQPGSTGAPGTEPPQRE